MKVKENYVREDSEAKVYDWGQGNLKLKYKYENQNASDVKVIKLSKEEMKEYLKKFGK